VAKVTVVNTNCVANCARGVPEEEGPGPETWSAALLRGSWVNVGVAPLLFRDGEDVVPQVTRLCRRVASGRRLGVVGLHLHTSVGVYASLRPRKLPSIQASAIESW